MKFYSPTLKLPSSFPVVLTTLVFVICGFGNAWSIPPENGPNALSPGSTFKDCSNCPELVVIPAGSFVMGNDHHDSGVKTEPGKITFNLAIMASDNKSPAHHVSINAPIAVGKYSVTFDEWDACVADGGCGGYVPKESPWGRGRMPVANVNWQDAQNYTLWLSKKTGKHFRLLSESEWEYAARANSTTAYYWGDEIGDGNANCCGTKWDETKLAPVGSFAPNAFALHDMLGHVWQWTADCWHKDYAGAPADGSAWIAGGDCSKRIIRGGYYQSPAYIVRVDNHNYDELAHRDYGIGFRIAREIP
jgi:formylglycine-generating enzyme required for sulfatase activity